MLTFHILNSSILKVYTKGIVGVNNCIIECSNAVSDISSKLKVHLIYRDNKYKISVRWYMDTYLNFGKGKCV